MATELPRLPAPTWFVGCGNMGQAIVGGWRAAGIDLSPAVVIRPTGMPVTGVRTVANYAEAGIPARRVLLVVHHEHAMDDGVMGWAIDRRLHDGVHLALARPAVQRAAARCRDVLRRARPGLRGNNDKGALVG